MIFIVGIYAAPDSSSARAGLDFIKTVLKKNQIISNIFFYEAGITHADAPSEFEQLIIPLSVCSALRPHPRRPALKPESLISYIDRISKADHHVIFR